MVNIDKGRTHEPRVDVQFSDKKLNAPVELDTFTFKAPPDAKEIEFSQLRKEVQN